jgi:hypothetical protein
MIRRLHRLFKDCRALATIELAIFLPVLLVLLIGTVEFGRLAIIQIKLDKVANSLADFVTQGTTVTQSGLDAYTATVPQIMKPFTYSGGVVYSSVVQTNVPIPPCDGTGSLSCITWQYKPDASTPNSRIGGVTDNADLPGNYAVLPAQNVIVVEVFFNYAPMLGATASYVPGLAARQLYKIAVFKPRLNNLTNLGL